MSSGRRILSNTGPLISLEKLSNGYGFIRRLYEKIIIPPVVLDEVAEGQFSPSQAYLHHFRNHRWPLSNMRNEFGVFLGYEYIVSHKRPPEHVV